MGRKGRRRPRRASPANPASTSTSMGQGRRQRRRPPPPPPESLYLRIVADLGDNLLIMVMFETPSGFAVFYADGISLYEPDAMQNLWGNFVTENRANHIVWRKDFQVFADKADAINLDDGLNSQLTDMLLKWHQPGQKLAVGKPEYKTIIEARLGIPCLFDEPVMEVMRGLNYLMHSFFPEEKSKQAEGECLRMSRGLRMLVDRYGFDDVKLDNVNECIIETACMLNDCDRCLKSIGESWRGASAFLEGVSSINSQDWDTLKLATALKMVCFSEEKIVFGDPHERMNCRRWWLMRINMKIVGSLRELLGGSIIELCLCMNLGLRVNDDCQGG
ncbi:hypothetical protein VPH35_058221 [Triticum aestivum]|uniref:nucleolar protein 58-like isoform X2 n=1 Tax=Triticum aestivum TaxID=4565 RepID=UPI001D023DD3|nr:nucleolar protein 58-like isoform X2 [Triticum aestivum]